MSTNPLPEMQHAPGTALSSQAIDVILREARSHHAWLDLPVTDDDLRAIHDLARWGPTSTNGNPARYVFVRTPDAKRRLSECVAAGNVEKVLRAPVIAIVAMDLDWWHKLPFLFPHKDMSGTYGTNPEKAAETALRNSSLQGAYLMIAARALGFDVGAMSGFDNAKVDAGFLGDTRWRSNFLCSIGHADPSRLYPRHPRFDFETVCTLI
jgi:3-hydroxypropanoate dehydrogenase